MTYKVFISYSRKDSGVADRICEELDKAGITYFIDRESIKGSEDFPEMISHAIRESELFLFLASRNSYQSTFTNKEIVYAVNNCPNSAILPYIIDDSDLPNNIEFLLSDVNWITMKDFPIESGLVPQITAVLNDPKILYNSKGLKRRKISWIFTVFLPIVTVIAILALVPSIVDRHRKMKADAAADKDKKEYLATVAKSDSLVRVFRRFQSMDDPEATVNDEIECLKKAGELLGASAKISKNYSNTSYSSLYIPDLVAPRKASLTSCLDSIFTYWKELAQDSYRLYRSGITEEKDYALKFINYALEAKPDKSLEALRQQLQ